ncbi:carbohydrate-binding domain-containing protein [Halalkalibacterium halodurans]|uniref:carbohydrate-binding domain-containing protein n=1 Tax=Halalkalibacterium halodurans TaxID=86665 RepID=UPI002AA97507|nr:carbohydrate-binding domain-containing protein [Halalkalibacterium halodurans]MDY7224450.1 carbohydrate-binding domain-containing protein [Halalkalibacterium halodurans]MDY7243735.1 carbohydrate-binding domain-containing protein [Halalkalibacterium halodurans]
MKKRNAMVAAALLSLSIVAACSDDSASATAETEESVVTTNEEGSELVTYREDDFYREWENENPTYIELKGTDVSYDGSAPVLFKDRVLTIKAGGVYVLSGELEDGQVVVDAEDQNSVKLVLNGATIHSSTSAAIYVVQAEKTILSLVDGTENVISDGEEYVYGDSSTDEPNAAIFSKDDLTINGSGALIVSGHYNNGITSKDELKVTGGTLTINAADDGLMGRDLVAVKDGSITIEAGGDGMKSTNDKSEEKGMIVLEGGTFNITAKNDGIQANQSLVITDGVYSIETGGGSPDTINNYTGRMRGPGEINQATDTESESTKGLKADGEVTIYGGTFTIDSLDDAVHSNSDVTVLGGDLTLSTGDDGIHADGAVTIMDGTITVEKSYEGIEGAYITIEGGTIDVTATDDGLNVAGGVDGSGIDIEGASEQLMLTINGGTINVNAGGDGLDANGSITMSDGIVIVNGPTDNMDGAIDYDQSFDISGGTIIAAGSSGMVQATSEQSTQPSILMTYSAVQAAGTVVHLEDQDGNTVVTFAPEKDYQAILISSPNLSEGSSYTLYSGGNAIGTEENGLYTEGSYEGGKEIVTFELSGSVTWLNESGVTTERATGPGGTGGSGGMGVRPESEGPTPPDQGGIPGGMYQELDEETRAEVEAIMEEARDGSITHEEMQAQLEERGIQFPARDGRPEGKN